jgi:hypothetical protein
MKIGSLAPRPACNDLPTVETQRQCALPPDHLAERKANEAAEVGAHTAHVVVKDVAHSLQELTTTEGIAKAAISKGIGVFVPGASAAAAGYKASQTLLRTEGVFSQQAELRGKAVGRENHDLAMAFLADQHRPGVFPKGYVDHRREQLMGPNAKLGDDRHTPHVVNRTVKQLESALETHQAGADKYLAYWAQNAGAGVREAQTREVRDATSLEAARKDKDFAAAYDKDPAFREGVRAGMWQAKVDPKAFAAAHDSFVKLQDQSFQAQIGRAQ